MRALFSSIPRDARIRGAHAGGGNSETVRASKLASISSNFQLAMTFADSNAAFRDVLPVPIEVK